MRCLPKSCLGLLALLLVVAAVIDIRTFTISNRLNLTVALLAPLYWWSVGLPLWPVSRIQVGLAVAVFGLFSIAFFLGMMGGGDVKLAAALALWFSPLLDRAIPGLHVALPVVSLTLFVCLRHRQLKKPGKPEVPYGVAIAIGALAILTQRFLNQFA